VGKVGIPPRLRDFQAEGESPAGGLFHAAAFSTALLPTNSATEPEFSAAIICVHLATFNHVETIQEKLSKARHERVFLDGF
jgi:hypothetical protein